MSRTQRWTAAVLASAVTGSILVTGAPAEAAGYSASLEEAVAHLTVAGEVRSGYQRDLFPLWIDADGNKCNTRYEVLIAEAVVTPDVSSPCALSNGEWDSWYDHETWTKPADLDIDHLVPLAEAWDSGARSWTTSRRKSYANDLADGRTLAAVTDSVNQDKGDRNPAEWMPPAGDVACRYIEEWVAVKVRWKLTVDTAEQKALAADAKGCPDTTIEVAYG